MINMNIPALAPDTDTPWSPFQQAVFDALETSTSSYVIEAVAGSGKTTTMVEGITRLLIGTPNSSVLAIAFNKSIQLTLEKRVPAGVDTRTFHGLGFAIIRRNVSKPRVFAGKSYGILKDICFKPFYDEYKRDLVRLVSLMKGTGLRPEEMSEDMVLDFMDNYDILIPSEKEEAAVTAVMQCIYKSAENLETIDFDDMLWVPIMKGWKWNEYDAIFVDEAQDLNPIQHEIVKRSLRKGGRVIAFGDRHQAIYGFRGAVSNSMDIFHENFDAIELPLSISYRCPAAVVHEAQRIVPHIQASAEAAQGTVETSASIPLTADPAAMVVCRNNRPLFKLGMYFLSRGVPCHIKGNFQAQLESFIKGFKTQDVAVLTHRMENWLEAETQKLSQREAWGKIAALEDKVGCVTALSAGASTTDDILDTLVDLTTEGRGLTLSSIHKAKGLEAETIYLYLPQLIPASYARSDSQKEQEYNLKYVAQTRSLSNLIYITEEPS